MTPSFSLTLWFSLHRPRVTDYDSFLPCCDNFCLTLYRQSLVKPYKSSKCLNPFALTTPTRKLPLVHQLLTMSSTPPPTTTTFSASSLMLGVTRLDRMLRQVYHSKFVVLQYNSGERGLSVWTWCVYIAAYKTNSHLLFSSSKAIG